MNVEQRVKKIIAEELCTTDGHIKNDSTLASLDMDSLDTVELVMVLESEFECEIPDGVADGFRTVQDVINYMVTVHP